MLWEEPVRRMGILTPTVQSEAVKIPTLSQWECSSEKACKCKWVWAGEVHFILSAIRSRAKPGRPTRCYISHNNGILWRFNLSEKTQGWRPYEFCCLTEASKLAMLKQLSVRTRILCKILVSCEAHKFSFWLLQVLKYSRAYLYGLWENVVG